MIHDRMGCHARPQAAGRVWRALGGGVLLAVLVNVIVIQPAFATFPGDNGRFAVHGCRQHFCSVNYDIFTVGQDGQGLKSVVSSRRPELGPSWSPNGRWLLYVKRTRSGRNDLFRARPDGSDPRRVTRTPSLSEGSADWSPDGKRVIYEVRRNSDNPVIEFRIKNLRTGAVRDLDPPGRRAFSPAWSPKGRRIAFTKGRRGDDTNLEIFTVRPDGSGLTRLTRNNVSEDLPDWSPNGRRLVFVRGARDELLMDDLWSMRADGTRKRRHWFDPDGILKVRSAVWSPDGRWIAFVAGGGAEEPELFRISRAPASEAVQLTHDDYDLTGVDWRPV
jgi:Tol biopolymer transport system component